MVIFGFDIQELIKKHKLGKKELLIASGSGLLVFVSLFIFLFLTPCLERIGRLDADLRSLKENLSGTENSIARKDSSQQKIADLNKRMVSYQTQLPTEQEIELVLTEISRMAKESDVKIISVTPITSPAITVMRTPSEGKKPYREYHYRLSGVAAYHNLGLFFNKIETCSRFIAIASVNLTGVENDKNCRVEMVITTYVLEKK